MSQNKRLAIKRIYTKDISFESPRSPFVFSQAWKPKIDIQLHNSHRLLEEDLYESSLKISLTGKLDDKTAFIIEVLQAGIFHLANMEKEEKLRILETTCPTTLFPYVREHIDSMLTKANFPPLMLAPINFEALYLKRQQEQEQGQGEEQGVEQETQQQEKAKPTVTKPKDKKRIN